MTSPGPAPSASGEQADARRRRDLARMKALATGLLVAMAAVYAVARRAEDAGAPGWVGFVRAAAEAGMVGALADWFAVTALFRRPLGLPIPHTAIIPTKKDQLGRNLGDFVGSNFLSQEVVRDRVRRADVVGRLGTWLVLPGNAARVGAEGAAVLRGVLGVLRDEDVHGLLEEAVVVRLAAVRAGPPAGRLLAQLVADGAHRGLVDLGLQHAHGWLERNRELVTVLVARQGPSWSPRFLDDAVGGRAHAELVRVVAEVRGDPDHPFRRAVDRYLAQLAADLQSDPDTMARADAVKQQVVDHPEVRAGLRRAWTSLRGQFLSAADDPGSGLRRRADEALVSVGARLVADAELRAKGNRWAEDAAAHVVATYRHELTVTITETVARWDADEASRRIELQVGRDLQFIRINGSVVGALAGVAIHAAGLLL